jgi:hypothetical protein
MNPGPLRDDTARIPNGAATVDAGLWSRVDRLLERASVEGIVFHELGAVEARRLRLQGRRLPPALEQEERGSVFRAFAVKPLLDLIRASATARSC